MSGADAIEVGCTEVWSKTRSRMLHDDLQPEGGIVVDRYERIDDQTGEFVDGYVTVDPYRPGPHRRVHIARVDRDDVDPDTVTRVDTERIRLLMRRLALQAATGVAFTNVDLRKGGVRREELDLARWAITLGAPLAPPPNQPDTGPPTMLERPQLNTGAFVD